MKRVLVLNGGSYVGKHVARSFYNSREYEVEVTLSTQLKRGSFPTNNETLIPGTGKPSGPIDIPNDMKDYVSRVVINHNESPDAFRLKVLENDIIVAVLEDDLYEAECTAKVLLGSHYNVEKTFVLVSSLMTWAETLPSERAKARAERRRAAALEAEEASELDRDDLTVDKAATDASDEAEEDYPDEELVPSRVFSEEDYAQRVPSRRYQNWKRLEQLVKHANSETLHTYVIAAGLPYGDGEGPLEDFLRAAWRHQPLEPLVPSQYDRFKRCYHRNNVVPMIHVQDLSAIVYQIGSAYDVLEERYLFAVDQGNCTVQQILDAVKAGFGDGVAWGTLPRISAQDEKLAFELLSPTGPAGRPKSARIEVPTGKTVDVNAPTSGYWQHFLLDIRAQPGRVLTMYEEDRWMALEGFVQNFDKVSFQFRQGRHLQPCRVMVTGPPLSGSETAAMALAAAYRVPIITAEIATASYERYAAALRWELRALLLGRLERRRNRAHARRVRAKHETEEEARQRRLEQRAAREGASDDDEEEEEEEEEEDGDVEEGDKDDRSSGLGSDEESGSGGGPVSELSEVFPEDRFEVDLASKLTDAYLLGEPNEAEDGDIEESEEDEDLLMDDDDESITPVQRCIRLQMLERDRAEKVRIQMLRDRYRLALKALSMKLVDGLLPRPVIDVEEMSFDEEEEGGNGSARRRGDDDESDEDEEADDSDGRDSGVNGEDATEEGENESESEKSSSSRISTDGLMETQDQTTTSIGCVGGNPEHGSEKEGRSTQYLEEAVAFFVRWRLQRADCRNQGYVLHGYPRTVNEARLVFRATAADDVLPDDPDGTGNNDNASSGHNGARLRLQRLQVPLTPEAVVPPVDFDFPLVDVTNLPSEARTAFNVKLQRRRASSSAAFSPLPLLTAPDDDNDEERGDEDEVKEDPLRAVSEALLPAHALVLTQRDLLAAGLPITNSSSNNGAPYEKEKAPLHKDGEVEQTGEDYETGDPEGESAWLRYFSGAGAVPTGDDVAARLTVYGMHHAFPAPPAVSLVTWLQSVGTTAVVGATPVPVVIHAAKPLRELNADEEEEAVDEGGAGQQSSRMVQVTMLEAPCRPVAVAWRELHTALCAAQFQLMQGLRGGPLQGIGGEKEPASISPNRSSLDGNALFQKAALTYISDPARGRPKSGTLQLDQEGAALPTSLGTESPLLELMQRFRHAVLDRDFMPDKQAHPQSRNNSKIDIDVSLGSFKSAEVQIASTEGTMEAMLSTPQSHDELLGSMPTSTERRLSASKHIERELSMLKQLCIMEESVNYRIAAQMPMEMYLATYVLPSLTPALTEVVKLRPEDPVTVLADTLFHYKRRTNV